MYSPCLNQKTQIMKNRLKNFVLIGCCLLTACSATTKKKEQKENKEITASQIVTADVETNTNTINEFPFPEIPLLYQEPEQRAKYLIEHYWDNINFVDTTLNYNSEMIEQAWVDYIDLNTKFNLESRNDNFIALTQRINQGNERFQKIYLNLVTDYLYNHNSPMRNELFYITIGEELLKNDNLDIAIAERLKFRIDLAYRNRVGTKAIDFKYTKNEGGKSSLYNTPAEHLIIFFNNPDCNVCASVREQLANTPFINEQINKGYLKIMVLYAESDFEEWITHSDDFPKNWIKAYNETLEISNNNLYDLQVTPSLYLMDKNKQVIIKDGAAEEIIHYLQEQ